MDSNDENEFSESESNFSEIESVISYYMIVNSNVNRDLEELIQERNATESYFYDVLVNPIFISENFWEPVKVGFGGVKELKDVIGEETCCICMESHLNFKEINCCHQKMCNDCSYKWFDSSVKCPYCYQDLREFNLKTILP